MSDDIVARLRESDGGYFMRQMFSEAADEIERLREALRIEQEELAACFIDRKETQRERDDARREVCEWVSLSLKRTPREVEIKRGWDCFGKYQDESGDECQMEAL
jgi:hypothetical protein